MHEHGGQPETSTDDESEADHIAAGLLNDKMPQSFRQPGFIQGDGKDKTAHDKDDNGVHVRRPGGFRINDPHEDKGCADEDRRDFQGDRLRQEEEDQYGQNRQEAHGLDRQTIDVVDLNDAILEALGQIEQVLVWCR